MAAIVNTPPNTLEKHCLEKPTSSAEPLIHSPYPDPRFLQGQRKVLAEEGHLLRPSPLKTQEDQYREVLTEEALSDRRERPRSTVS